MADQKIFKFSAIYTGLEKTGPNEGNCIVVSLGGKIESIGTYEQISAQYPEVKTKNSHKLEHTYEWLDYSHAIAIPGFIDMHVHGGNGADVMDATFESLNTVSKYLATKGVTAFLATTVSAPIDVLEHVAENIAMSMTQGLDGAMCLGCYLEGPFLSEIRKGAHASEYLCEPTVEAIKKLIDATHGNLKIVALAPELKNSMACIEYLKSEGIRVSLGHSDCEAHTADEAFDRGATIAVHLFNGMRPFHHRAGGLASSALYHTEVYTELIADGIHVHESALKVVFMAKGKDKICLISDCMRAGGLGDGKYLLGDLEVQVTDGIARVASGSLAGSTLDLNQALKNIMKMMAMEISEVLPLLSKSPAEAIGVSNNLGTLEIGKLAHITALSDTLDVVGTIVSGRVVFNREVL